MDAPQHGAETASDRPVYTVTRLNHEARGLLEANFPLLWVEGELSNVARPASGHMYFTLKDEQAQVRCAMFKGKNRLLRFRPEDGMHVLVRAQISLYAPRGDFQLIVEHMEEAGEGALQRAFEELKRKLSAEGLFADELKRPLPALPRRVGVITSASGAAVRDVLTTLRRRFPALPVVVYPVPVQGQAAAPAIVEAFDTANRRAECDVLILARGGGSLEDLWSFNEPEVARAIRASAIPVVVGVGHEVDYTIADLAADLRAPTPTAAAERVSPDRAALLRGLGTERERLTRALERRLRDRAQGLDHLRRRLIHPGRRLRDLHERNRAGRQRLARALARRQRERRRDLKALVARLHRAGPARRLPRDREQADDLRQRLIRATTHTALPARRQRLQSLARELEAVSPLGTLARGYAVARRDGQILRRAEETETGDTVNVQLGEGSLDCRVEERHLNGSPDTEG
ncbi:exodeoxyribonuclease VII large subunit [Thiohalorhabdus denitrificans]|uniref:Exodeoxyribonuclease 7 large subunit n=1 Tax=Thiohalorhabdus denitrificans TaxID=381306 RepID=A0A0P9EPR7_9GAMM|nr:exodeoxyribonuclease VII large subunit [Thiohalorhabdus denitrificans]KPV40483.1 exodeoxyribonuclease VII large subunit [Thiohalorhabdus denitrificans]SCY62074.1 Exodeoxyribonuclease VII large subunit [Thiohalorhabdus denitrificans]